MPAGDRSGHSPAAGRATEVDPLQPAAVFLTCDRSTLEPDLRSRRGYAVLPAGRAARPERKHAIENLLVSMEGDFVAAGYRLVMAQGCTPRTALRVAMLLHSTRIWAGFCWSTRRPARSCSTAPAGRRRSTRPSSGASSFCRIARDSICDGTAASIVRAPGAKPGLLSGSRNDRT